MDWTHALNRDLMALNDAHSSARIDTGEYRRRRRELLDAAVRTRGAALHTLRRPATGMRPIVAPVRRRVKPRASIGPWVVATLVVVSVAALGCGLVWWFRQVR
ncbi:hypothetical protein [Luteibacter sp. CQ10]|uniref:hypothetical protein n=1 Tax=Luteibacter sp. CQ10 TaxID=2805821 RepID=UPI0034A25D6B